MDVIAYIIGLLITGVIIGVLARLVIPGRQPIGFLNTILAGIAGSFLAGLIFWAVADNPDDNPIIGFALAVACAALIVWFISRGTRREPV